MKQIILKSIIRNGLYAGAILAVYFLLLYLLNRNFMQMVPVTFIIQAVITILFMFVAIAQARKMIETRKISFGNAFLIALSIMLGALLCFLAMKILVLFVIDGEYLQKCVMEVYLQLIDTMKKYPEYAGNMGNPEDVKLLLKVEYHLPVVLYYVVEAVVAGALVALVAKKKDKPEDSLIAQ